MRNLDLAVARSLSLHVRRIGKDWADSKRWSPLQQARARISAGIPLPLPLALDRAIELSQVQYYCHCCFCAVPFFRRVFFVSLVG